MSKLIDKNSQVFSSYLKKSKLGINDITIENIENIISKVIENNAGSSIKEIIDLVREQDRISTNIKSKYELLQNDFHIFFDDVKNLLKEEDEYGNYSAKLNSLKFKYIDTSDLIEESVEVGIVDALDTPNFSEHIELLIKDITIKILREDEITKSRIDNLVTMMLKKVIFISEAYLTKREDILIASFRGLYDGIQYSIARFKKILGSKSSGYSSKKVEMMIKDIDNPYTIFNDISEKLIKTTDNSDKEVLKKALSKSNLKLDYVIDFSRQALDEVKDKIYSSLQSSQVKLSDANNIDKVKSKLKFKFDINSFKNIKYKENLDKIVSNLKKK